MNVAVAYTLIQYILIKCEYDSDRNQYFALIYFFVEFSPKRMRYTSTFLFVFIKKIWMQCMKYNNDDISGTRM